MWGGMQSTGIRAIILLFETGRSATHMPHAVREPFVVLFSLFVLEVIRRILTVGTDGTASFHNSTPGEPGNMRTWCNGSTSAFQAEDAGSIPVIRSTTQTVDNQLHSFGWCSGCPLHAAVAQLVERLTCNQLVRGSKPLGSSILTAQNQRRKEVSRDHFRQL